MSDGRLRRRADGRLWRDGAWARMAAGRQAAVRRQRERVQTARERFPAVYRATGRNLTRTAAELGVSRTTALAWRREDGFKARRFGNPAGWGDVNARGLNRRKEE